MKYVEDDFVPSAVRAAYEVVDLWEENLVLRREAAEGREWRDKYMALLNESVKRGQEDAGNWLRLLMSDRIKFVEAPPQTQQVGP
jgi:hypothetical protein